MNLYPALKASMGSWTYYVVKMTMREIVNEVGFASEIYSNKTLDDAIQRSLNESRVKNEIVQYLGRRDDRFFSSIVVAALGGNPEFIPVDIAHDPRFELFRPANLVNSFGVLTFIGGQRYFALDGQHRLKAIKTLIEQGEADVPEIPEGFIDEEVSVIMIVREETDEAEFMKSYRRIFSSLNRYAKPTDADTNIIMDEDDAVAILTRRLIIEHDFFVWRGTPTTSPKLKTKGKNLRSGDSYFTTLQTLYAMNETLLHTPERGRLWRRRGDYRQFRPAEEELDGMFSELMVYWNAISSEIDVLNSEPATMREHDAELDHPDGHTDHLLFWPIGQELFASVARIMMNRRLPDPSSPTEEDVRACIRVLAEVEWDLRMPPWMGLLLVEDSELSRGRRRRMRSEDRKRALEVAQRILLFQVGIDDYANLEELKVEWQAMLIPLPGPEEVEERWRVISRQIG